MRILFVDDTFNRHQTFARVSVPHEVHYILAFDKAVELLGQGHPFDMAYLDHDMGGPESEGLVVDNADDGRKIARVIADKASSYANCIFIVHSLNSAGGRAMLDILRDAGLTAYYVPFGWRVEPKQVLDKINAFA